MCQNKTKYEQTDIVETEKSFAEIKNNISKMKSVEIEIISLAN